MGQLARLLGVGCDDLARVIEGIETDIDTPGVVRARKDLAEMIRGADDRPPPHTPTLRIVKEDE
jgi:hypothetical protein